MYPPIFEYVAANAGATALLGSSPTRFWPFGLAPQPGSTGYALPYAVHQLVYGTPENTLGCTPTTDNIGLQIDAYGKSATEARAVLTALRDALEPYGYVVSYNGESWEAETGLYRASFTVEFWEERGS
jgi:hypothetical protein